MHRPPLDAQRWTGKRGRELGRRYVDAVLRGDGVLEDLDEALALRDAAVALGVLGLEVVVFEVPREPAPHAGQLAQALAAPADDLELLGYDVIECLEPYWSALVDPPVDVTRNRWGLLDRRADADALAVRMSSHRDDGDEPLSAVRVWRASAPAAAVPQNEPAP